MPHSDVQPMTFANALIDGEFNALCAAYDEPDDSKFAAIVSAGTLPWYDASIADDGYRHDKFQRPYTPDPVDEDAFPGWDPGPPIDHAADRAKLRRASVLRWMRYPHPEHGELLRFDLDPAKPLMRQRMLKRALFAWSEGGELRVRAIYGPCRSCKTRGLVELEPCSACDGRGWVHRYGTPLAELGEPTEVHKLLRPEYPPHAESFDAS